MTGEAPPHERLARQLVEGRVGHVRRDERGLARAVDLRGRAAPRAVAAAVVPRQAQEMRREQMTANNYANGLLGLQRFGEAKALLRTTIPVALRVLGESDTLKLTMRKIYATALYKDPAATRGDLRKAVNTLEETGRIAQRVLGGTHPITVDIEDALQDARDALYARGLP